MEILNEDEIQEDEEAPIPAAEMDTDRRDQCRTMLLTPEGQCGEGGIALNWLTDYAKYYYKTGHQGTAAAALCGLGGVYFKFL